MSIGFFTCSDQNRCKTKKITIFLAINSGEYILFAGGVGSGVARFHTGYAQFSLATTGNVTNSLSHCTLLNDFYGAGCQGKVNETVTSALTDCTVGGNVFGGGNKAVVGGSTTVNIE